MNILQKFKEILISVLPIMIIVVLLYCFISPIDIIFLSRFLIGGILVIIGLTIFLIGVDIGILPIGEQAGAALTSKKNLPLLLIVSFFIGILITIAEPDVQVLAEQIRNVSSNVNKWVMVIMIALGIGLFVVIGLLRTILSIKLKYIFIVSYILLFTLAILSPKEFQGVAFDAGGATTGPMTVPFIMALGMGVASVRMNKSTSSSSDDNSFGLTGIASIGPIMAVCIYGFILKFGNTADPTTDSLSLAQNSETVDLGLKVFLHELPHTIKEVSLALIPLLIMFILFQLFLLKMPPFQVKKMFTGIFYSYIGLILFLLGANCGFMPTGEALGLILSQKIISNGILWEILLVIVALIFGAIVVCAEPAVWVLTEQVENISGGTIKKNIMLIALSCGVALSIGISVIRIIHSFSLWYILIPGYAIALILTLWTPPLFTGIAFDSGGVASGPMTSTFILSFTLGIANVFSGGSVTDAFGVIALVAMTPLIAIQILGIIYKIKNDKAQKHNAIQEN